ncbi:MAG: HesA/MoeB/ThiF family protein [Alphaproteobacteria bacterium]
MELTDDQLDRYARHIVLHEIGGPGQQKLLRARVLVIGAGGLGSPVLLYLAAAGVGHLGIVDDDNVSLSNLQRQIIHHTEDTGRAKTRSAREAIAALNPDIQVSLHETRLTEANAHELVSGYDLVADGSDNFATRYAVHDACFGAGRTLVSAAVGRFEGQLATFKAHERPEGRQVYPCYRCLFPEAPPEGTVPACSEAGILGALTGVLGSLQAMEVIKEITGVGESMAGRLMIYDALSAESRIIRVPPDPQCSLCGKGGAAQKAEQG